MEISSSKSLPENAYRPLKPGESYEPIVPAGSAMQEFTPRSVTLGIVMAAVFSAAAAFLGLKVGQVFEAAIPIAILAVGFGYAFTAVYLIWSIKFGKVVTDPNPWGATGLEWTTQTPPIPHNFEVTPRVTQEAYAYHEMYSGKEAHGVH